MNKKIFIASFMAFAVSLFLSGCDNDNEGEDSYWFSQCGMFVRFVSPAGTNVIDSLSLVQFQSEDENGEAFMRYDCLNDDVVLSRCIRESDGAEIEIANDASYFSYWHKIPKFDDSLSYSSHHSGLGTILFLRWTDPHIFAFTDAPKKEYEQTYTVYLKSPKIFGDDKERTIKWYVYVNRNIYNAYKCEVNGVEFDFMNSDIWMPQEYGKWIQIAHIVPVPVNL